MDWKQLLAYITGSVDQELLLRNEYLVTENRMLRTQLQGRVRLSDGERKTLGRTRQKTGQAGAGGGRHDRQARDDLRKETHMRVLKIEDPTHIQLPEDVGERLGLQQGDVVVMTLEAHRVILEKRTGSPVDASFGLWAHLPPGPAYVDTLRDEWDTRLTERLSNG